MNRRSGFIPVGMSGSLTDAVKPVSCPEFAEESSVFIPEPADRVNSFILIYGI